MSVDSSLAAATPGKDKTFPIDGMILKLWAIGLDTSEIARVTRRRPSEVANRLARLRDAAVAG